MNELTQSSRTPIWCKGVLLAGMLLFAFYASTHMVAAGDTWVALACGRHFAEHGVDNVEPFSFNSHPAGPTDEQLKNWPAWTHGIIRYWHPTGWINQNWLTHLTYYKLASWFGSGGKFDYNALVVWKFALYVATVLTVFAIGKTIGAGDFLSALAACLAMVVGRSFFDIRPAGYSNLLAPVYVLVLALATYKNYRWIWLLVPLVVFWANVHGGYIYAFIMLVPFIGIHLLLLLPKRWTVSLGFIGLWLFLYLLSYKFLTHDSYVKFQQYLNPQFEPVSLIHNSLLWIWIVLAGISILLASMRTVSGAAFYFYHFLAGFIYFVSLLTRYFVRIPPLNLTKQFKELLAYHISSSQGIFIFMAVVGVLLILAMALKKERFVALPVRGLVHTIGVGAAAFVAMVIFNPYHLTNLTHTFEISVSKHAESWRMVNEWKPAFDWMDKTTTTPNPVGDEEWFEVLCILTAVVIVVWLAVYFIRPRTAAAGSRKASKGTPAAIDNAIAALPKVDLAILVVSLLTLYMAVQSRRFIALAGSVAAPAIFLLVLQTGQMIWARFGLRDEVSKSAAMKSARAGACALLGAAIAILGIHWGVKYKKTYLDPWPAENRYTSVFMRMTASHLKPFEVCDFINENHLSGRVFNYWTEGGALAFGQTTDPKTGEIPLKLFMDGRAQAAYNHDVFQRWQEINLGGPIARELLQRGKDVSAWTPQELKDIGNWIGQQLTAEQVWIVLMPKSQDDSNFMKALEATANWKTGYLDNTQHILINKESEPGKKLLDEILEGKAKFPDAASKSMTTITAIFENNYNKRLGDLYTLAKEGFDAFPYPAVTANMTRVSGVPEFRQNVTNDLKAYLKDFEQNKTKYRQQDGYLLRLASAEIAARYLTQRVESDRSLYAEEARRLRKETENLHMDRIW